MYNQSFHNIQSSAMEAENENINTSNAAAGANPAPLSSKGRPHTAPAAATPVKPVAKNGKSDFKVKQSKAATPLGSKTPGNPHATDAVTPGKPHSTVGKSTA